MPEYHFTGTSPRVLTGLSQGVNAWVAGSEAPYGSTVEAQPGCGALTTSEPYLHPELEEFEDAPVSPAEPVVPIQLVAAPEPVADQAPADMTAEGAPAPAEPTN